MEDWGKWDDRIISWLALYGKYPKISYTKVSNKIAYANSADPDQTAPTLFDIPLNILRTA